MRTTILFPSLHLYSPRVNAVCRYIFLRTTVYLHFREKSTTEAVKDVEENRVLLLEYLLQRNPVCPAF